jgi:hypothetical protein
MYVHDDDDAYKLVRELGGRLRAATTGEARETAWQPTNQSRNSARKCSQRGVNYSHKPHPHLNLNPNPNKNTPLLNKPQFFPYFVTMCRLNQKCI